MCANICAWACVHAHARSRAHTHTERERSVTLLDFFPFHLSHYSYVLGFVGIFLLDEGDQEFQEAN